MLLDSLNNGCLPPTLRQSCISLILKKDKDPHECGLYRPISLLNVDVKILAKMLAKRLESVLPTIIHSDQTGFIKNRLLSHNIRRAFNIIYSSILIHRRLFYCLTQRKPLIGWNGITFLCATEIRFWQHVHILDKTFVFLPSMLRSGQWGILLYFPLKTWH